MAEGKTIEQCEDSLRKAYQDRNHLHWVFGFNLSKLLLRKSQNNMTINSHNRDSLGWWKDSLASYFYYNLRIGTPDPNFDYKADLSWWKDSLDNYFYKDMRIN